MEYESTLWYIVRKSSTPFIPNERWFMSSPTFPTPEPDDPGPEPSPELGASGPSGPDGPASQPVPTGGNDGHHHRVKQAQGWWLDMPEPGLLRWRTPAGRTYTTTPTVYPLD